MFYDCGKNSYDKKNDKRDVYYDRREGSCQLFFWYRRKGEEDKGEDKKERVEYLYARVDKSTPETMTKGEECWSLKKFACRENKNLAWSECFTKESE